MSRETTTVNSQPIENIENSVRVAQTPPQIKDHIRSLFGREQRRWVILSICCFFIGVNAGFTVRGNMDAQVSLISASSDIAIKTFLLTNLEAYQNGIQEYTTPQEKAKIVNLVLHDGVEVSMPRPTYSVFAAGFLGPDRKYGKAVLSEINQANVAAKRLSKMPSPATN